jgi:hypothetical protein
MRFGIKLLLAATSGVLVAVIAIHDIDDERLGVVLSFLYFYGVSGALFSTAILWPYLERNSQFLYRGAGLVVASVLSYWTAIRTHELVAQRIENTQVIPLEYLAASLVGAAIAFVAAIQLAGLPSSRRLLGSALAAAVIGGLLFEPLMGLPYVGLTGSFIAWHCLMCGALHFGTPERGLANHA